ncbi:MAG: 50S ribosomal protein L27 [Patescibacteria group bacterium]|nr:50S ribosomal protein L27 [Patescibacteria group bacterium]
MAHKKAGGTASNLRDSKPKYLGVKIFGNQAAKAGNIIVRQRGNQFRLGKGVMQGKDHTIFAVIDGFVKFTEKQITKFNGNKKRVKFVSIVESKTPQNEPKKIAVK